MKSKSKLSIEASSMPRKRRKLSHDGSSKSTFNTEEPSEFPRGRSGRDELYAVNADSSNELDLNTSEMKHGESITWLRNMVLGKVEYTDAQMAYVKSVLRPIVD